MHSRRHSLAFALTVLGFLALLGTEGRGLAQTGQPTGFNPTKTDFLLRVEKKVDGKWVLLPDIEASLFFNRARCECDEEVAIRVELSNTGAMKRLLVKEGNLKLIAGPAACVDADPSKRPTNNAGCTTVKELPPLQEVAKGPQEVETTVRTLFTAGTPPAGQGCAATFSQSLWLWVDINKDQSPDMTVSASEAPNLPISIDGEAPLPPTSVTVTPGNEALNVQWTRSTLTTDQNGVVVFCSRAGLPVFSKTYFTGNEYQSAQTVCPDKHVTAIPTPLLAYATTGKNPGATPVAPPDEFRRLDSRFVCSDLLTTATDWRIKILQNGIPYLVGVAAVDSHGNASPIEMAFLQTPIPTRDFYRAYRAAGGESEGGYCAYGQRARPAGWALAAAGLLGFALVRAGRRRR
jgi:hypothetical protein